KLRKPRRQNTVRQHHGRRKQHGQQTGKASFHLKPVLSAAKSRAFARRRIKTHCSFCHYTKKSAALQLRPAPGCCILQTNPIAYAEVCYGLPWKRLGRAACL